MTLFFLFTKNVYLKLSSKFSIKTSSCLVIDMQWFTLINKASNIKVFAAAIFDPEIII